MTTFGTIELAIGVRCAWLESGVAIEAAGLRKGRQRVEQLEHEGDSTDNRNYLRFCQGNAPKNDGRSCSLQRGGYEAPYVENDTLLEDEERFGELARCKRQAKDDWTDSELIDCC
jgi:hypothetical protein